MVRRDDASLSMAEQFRAIAEIGGDVAWSLDCASGNLVYVSAAIEELLGYPMDEVLRQCNDSGGPLAPLCAGLAQRLARHAGGDASRLRLVREHEVMRGDGSMVPVEITSMLLLDAQGQPGMLVGTMRDLRERHAREQERRRFASMLNHEFRTPLSTIDGAIQRLEATHGGDEATRARYRKIGVATDRLIAMLDDYLSPERMVALGRQRRPTTVSPQLLLDECAARVRAAGRHVAIEAAGLPAAVRGEPDGLRLALKVLADNAIQYAPGDSAITLIGRTVSDGIVLQVRDAGPGVPDGEACQVFDKFFRGSNASGMPGSGLGLYMARAVIEVHGGTLTMLPASAGATFQIWLPIRDVGKHLAST